MKRGIYLFILGCFFGQLENLLAPWRGCCPAKLNSHTPLLYTVKWGRGRAQTAPRASRARLSIVFSACQRKVSGNRSVIQVCVCSVHAKRVTLKYSYLGVDSAVILCAAHTWVVAVVSYCFVLLCRCPRSSSLLSNLVTLDFPQTLCNRRRVLLALSSYTMASQQSVWCDRVTSPQSKLRSREKQESDSQAHKQTLFSAPPRLVCHDNAGVQMFFLSINGWLRKRVA